MHQYGFMDEEHDNRFTGKQAIFSSELRLR